MNKRLRFDDFTFFCIYLLGMIDSLCLSLSTISELPHINYIRIGFRLSALVFILLKLLFDRRYSAISFIWLAVSGVILLISFLLSKYNHVLYLLFAVLGVRSVNIHKLIRFDWLARIVLSGIVIGMALLGVTENFVTYRTGSTVLRYSLGFSHPNTLATVVLTLILEEAWLKKRRFTMAYMGVVLLLAAITYVITANRTAVALMLIFPFTLLWGCSKRQVSTAQRVFFQLLYPFCAALSVYLMIYYNRSAVERVIDLALSSRFANANRVFGMYGFSLLGQPVQLVSVKIARLQQRSIAMLDVGYLRCLIQAGAGVFIVIWLMYTRLINRLCRNADRYTLVIVMLFYAYAFAESGFNNVYMNFTLLLAAQGVYASYGGSLPCRKA